MVSPECRERDDCLVFCLFAWFGDSERALSEKGDDGPGPLAKWVSSRRRDWESFLLPCDRDVFEGLPADDPSGCCIYHGPGPLEDMWYDVSDEWIIKSMDEVGRLMASRDDGSSKERARLHQLNDQGVRHESR